MAARHSDRDGARCLCCLHVVWGVAHDVHLGWGELVVQAAAFCIARLVSSARSGESEP
jgi:hypothetical protein